MLVVVFSYEDLSSTERILEKITATFAEKLKKEEKEREGGDGK